MNDKKNSRRTEYRSSPMVRAVWWVVMSVIAAAIMIMMLYMAGGPYAFITPAGSVFAIALALFPVIMITRLMRLIFKR